MSELSEQFKFGDLLTSARILLEKDGRSIGSDEIKAIIWNVCQRVAALERELKAPKPEGFN